MNATNFIPSYCFFNFYNENTHTCQRSIIENDERDEIQDLLTPYLFSPKEINTNKSKLLTGIYKGDVDLFIVHKSLKTPRTEHRLYS